MDREVTRMPRIRRRLTDRADLNPPLLAILLLLTLFLSWACPTARVYADSAAGAAGAAGWITGSADLTDKRLAVLVGSVQDLYASEHYPQATITRYKSIPDMVQAVKSGKADATIMSREYVRELIRADDSLQVVGEPILSIPVGAGFNQANDSLREQFNAFLGDLKDQGIRADMVSRWMDQGLTTIPELANPGTQGTLTVGCTGDLGLPFDTTVNGNRVGFDVELAERFAAYLGKKLVLTDMDFGSLIAAVSTNKVDMILASIFITEERMKKIDFSDAYHQMSLVFMVLKANVVQNTPARLSTLADINGKRVGLVSGTIYDAYVRTTFPQAKLFHFNSTADILLALQNDKIDVGLMVKSAADLILAQHTDIGILSDQVLAIDLGMGFNKQDPELLAAYNQFLQDIRASGVYADVTKRWFDQDPNLAVMPDIPAAVTGEKLVVGVAVADLPYVAYNNNQYVGFDIELVRRFAAAINRPVEFVNLEFASLVMSLAAGKVDMITDSIAITPERAKMINFSDPYASAKSVALATKKNLAVGGLSDKPATVSFWQGLRESFYNNIILENRYRLILTGLRTTTVISLAAAVLGTLLGALVCWLRMSRRRWLQMIARTYITILRGLPALVLLLIIFYIIFASVSIDPLLVSVVAFALNFAAYVSEMFRSAIQSIDQGQTEAGIASGFTRSQTFIWIILPQAARRVLPIYKGELISMVKMTSIVGYIAVEDLTKAGDIIRSRTFDAFFPLIMVAILYFALSGLLIVTLGWLERRSR